MPGTTARPTPPALVALTPGDAEAALDGRLERAVARALEAGLPGLLVREPLLEDGPFLKLASRLREHAERCAVRPWFAIHDRVHLAAELGVNAVHLGGGSLPPYVAREQLPEAIAIGFSSHVDDAPAAWRGADHLFLSPVRTTASKPGAAAIGFEPLAERARASGLPVLALGGLVPGDLARARAHGAVGIAVLSGILLEPDPGRAALRYLAP
ncbi:Regulatory protein TenI [Planctomycetes bacterium Pla163]|uniref:Regulatory protein TenI n=1 Tax=Rohdeia mirabilis TaxID=2528008 RepID=A0A518D0G4_9BACT|nr:Regulatory protein TenI [Planctomycetes bacterium Pla163]